MNERDMASDETERLDEEQLPGDEQLLGDDLPVEAPEPANATDLSPSDQQRFYSRLRGPAKSVP